MTGLKVAGMGVQGHWETDDGIESTMGKDCAGFDGIERQRLRLKLLQA